MGAKNNLYIKCKTNTAIEKKKNESWFLHDARISEFYSPC